MEIARLLLAYLQVLIWPAVALGIVLLLKAELKGLLSRIRHADLPGGVSLDLQEEIKEARELSEKVEASITSAERAEARAMPLTEANARLMQLGLRPSPSGLDMSYYRDLAEQDPIVALAGLRIEVDAWARNLADDFKVPVGTQDSSSRLLRRLYDSEAITTVQMQLGQKVLELCDAAVHGTPVSYKQALEVLDIAEVLGDYYLAWLSWRFVEDLPPTVGIDAL